VGSLLSLAGNGIKMSAKFTTGADWKLTYTYDYAGFGDTGNFQVMVIVVATWAIKAEFRSERDKVDNGPNPASRVNLLSANVCSGSVDAKVEFFAVIVAATGEDAVADSLPTLTHIALRMGFHELHKISAEVSDLELVHQ
jgi:hypothetical protein